MKKYTSSIPFSSRSIEKLMKLLISYVMIYSI